MYFRKIRKPVLIAACLLLMTLGGCSLTRNAPVLEPEAEVKELGISTSFYPIYIMTLNITKDVPGIRLTNISAPDTGCLHEVQLSPAELKLLEQSEIFIINGLGMEGYLDKVIESLPNLKVVDSSRNLNLTSLRSGISEDYTVSKEHEIHEKHDSHINPHTWVSISLAIEQVKNIGEQLSNLDPKNREQYLKNTEDYIAILQDLKVRMHEGLADINSREIITFHEAFHYFAQEFNLDIQAVVQREPGSEPSAKELAETINLVQENRIKAIFVEPQYSDSAAQAIARETRAKVYTLDPAVTGPLVTDAYILAMEENLLTLQEALKE